MLDPRVDVGTSACIFGRNLWAKFNFFRHKKGGMPPLVSKIKKILVENGSMNYWWLLFFFISDNTGVRELAPYPMDKKTKALEMEKKIIWTTKEMCSLKPNRCHFMTFLIILLYKTSVNERQKN